MKKRYVVLACILLVLILGIFVIPVLFKDDIQRLVAKKLNEKLNATIYFDEKGISLSLLKNFPNLTVSTGPMGIVGIGEFTGDTLMQVADLKAELDIISVIKGEKIEIEGIGIDEPKILVKVLKDGKANYDIVPPSEEAAPDTAQSDVAIGIKYWEIKNGTIVYDDRSMPFMMKLEGLNHTGKGDFASQVFDMITKTEASALTVEYDGMTYLEQVPLLADVTMGMDLGAMRFTFKDNTAKLNEFAFGFAGDFTYSETAMGMDITFDAKETSFKSLLSLMPSAFSKDLANVETEGSIAFNGLCKGQYTETTMPGFKVALQVKDGRIKYPDLPSDIKNVQVDMVVDAADGNYDQMLIDIAKFEMMMGQNPVSGKVRAKMQPASYLVNADVLAKLNLAELNTIYPIEGLEMKGLYELRVKADGVYSDASSTIPKIDAAMKLTDGYIRSKDYPVPVEQLHFEATAINTSGKMDDFVMDITDASLMMDGKPLKASGKVENIADPTYSFIMDGGMDLAIVEKVYPIEGMKLAGQIEAHINTKGRMSDIDAGRYEKLPTSGSLVVSNLSYADKDLPQGIKITSAKMQFTPKEIVLSEYKGFLGESDVELNGKIVNYLSYVLKDEPIVGQFKMQSNRFNSNEWMVSSDGEPVEEEAGSYGVVSLPESVDFRFDASVKEFIYEKFTLKNILGGLHLKDGQLRLESLGFESFGGLFTLGGLYDPRNLSEPRFDFQFSIKDLPFIEAYQNYSTIQALAPITKSLSGKFSTSFNIAGILGQDLMPVASSLSGSGNIDVADATVNSSAKLVESLSRISEMKALQNPKVRNFKFDASIENGRFKIKPTPLEFGGYTSTLVGSAGIDGTIDFNMRMDVPKSQLPPAMSKLVGNVYETETVPVTMKIGGSYNVPIVGLDKTEWEAAIKSKVDAEKDKLVEEAKETAKETAKDALKDAASGLLGGSKDTTKVKTDTAQQAKPAPKPVEEGKKKLEELKKKLPIGGKKTGG